VEYSDVGATVGAVNFPQAQLPGRAHGTRYVHVHQNVPGILSRRTVDRRRLVSGFERFRRWRKFLRAAVKQRFEIMLRPPFVNIVALVGVVFSFANFVLGPLPFGSFPSGIAFIVIGLGLTARDGLLVALGIAIGIGALFLASQLLPY